MINNKEAYRKARRPMTTILLLDDNSDIVTLLEMVLNQQGYEVISGRNGQEGLEYARTARIRA